MYCLWLNGKKVFDLKQLKEAFDPKALELYCLGGGLVRWLDDCGETEIADKVKNIDQNSDIPLQLAGIFGVEYDLPQETPKECASDEQLSFGSSSFLPSSFEIGSFLTSFELNSFGGIYTSFLIGSFMHEYEYEFESGSFASGSFSLGSFSSESFAYGSSSFGSFSSGSFSLSSFHLSDLGSLSLNPLKPLTAEQKVHINLSSCPMNRYGYGIHLV